ncbi:hypothetical protein S40285_10898, partial [Stachybotrys chlorohalonatus IBT 40285]
MPLKLFQVFLP